MARDWDHYLFAIGEDLASIYLDLEAAKTGPMPSHQHSSMISVSMLRAQDNGMSSDEEFEDLIALEDDLDAQVREGGAHYVGRVTTRGRRIFYFYTAEPEAIEAAASSVMERHPAYQYQVGSRPDPDWSTYFDFLYPRPADHERMMKRRLS